MDMRPSFVDQLLSLFNSHQSSDPAVTDEVCAILRRRLDSKGCTGLFRDLEAAVEKTQDSRAFFDWISPILFEFKRQLPQNQALIVEARLLSFENWLVKVI